MCRDAIVKTRLAATALECGTEISDWLHNLPVPWMALVVLRTTYFLAAAIFAVANLIGKAERARAFKAIFPIGIFATGIAVSVLLIAAHYRPFTGQISVGPNPLLQLPSGRNSG